MFWVGLDARLIPPDEFQADSPQNQSQQGPAAQMCTPRRLSENSGRFGVHGLDLRRRGLTSEMRRSCGEELRPGLETWGHTTIDTAFLVVPNPAS